MEMPESLEGRWDLLYRDYPLVYDEFARIAKRPSAVEAIDRRFPLRGLTVVDVGAGSGLSTIELARYSRFVIGVEPGSGMLALAQRARRALGAANMSLVAGVAEEIPLRNGSADVVAAITLSNDEVARSAAAMERVARPGGLVLRVDIAPGWYGGELEPIITGKARDESSPVGGKDAALADRGYDAIDFFQDQEYGDVETVARTYGFIHGKRVIDYVRAHGVTSIRWKCRVRYRTV